MIIPNLMVTDMARSVAFWRDALGFAVTMTVDAARESRFGPEADPDASVFTILEGAGGQLMLQTVESLAADLPSFAGGLPDRPGIGIYLRDLSPDEVLTRLPEGAVLKAPETAWYGMRELFLRDPDGHVICVAAAEGPAPA
ncbi:VOC family protein [uncultured Albimonas sp.]|uniref:VOC family protein n=1 Tax=uncultured Albimonas sp. TaxID=1331701 RepID=UPI0030EF3A03